MAPIRRSNRASKPRVYWNPTNSPPHRRQPPAFLIYTEPPEDLSTQLSHQDLGSGSDLGPDASLDLGSDLGSDADLDSELSDEDLGSELSEEGLGEGLDESLDEGLDKFLDELLDKSLDEALDKALHRQLHEGLGMDLIYQPHFPSKNRAGRPQNLSENSDPLKLFQLFFTVKEMKNIVKQINQQAQYIDFESPWKSLTVIEIYCYLECLIYMRIQLL